MTRAVEIRPFDIREQLEAEFIPFGDFIPDVSPLGHPGCLVARNCVPRTNSFGELLSLTPFTNALSGKALGHTWAQATDGSYHNYAGDNTTLYELVEGKTWESRNAEDVEYAATTWEFVTWGDFVIAVSGEHSPQYLDLSVGGSRFQDLADEGETPPVARHAGIVRDWLVLGDIDNHPSRVHWSGYDDPTKWGEAAGTTSDFQDLPAHLGRVQRIVPGEYGLIFTEHAITVMQLSNDPGVVWQFNTIEKSVGTPAPRSVCWLGNNVFFYSWGGFYLFDGQQLIPIGANKVDSWFSEFASSTAFREVHGVIDRDKRLVLWSFPSRDALEGVSDTLLIYNMVSDRWSYARIDSGEEGTVTTELMTEYIPSDVTLEELDEFYPELEGGIDAEDVPSFDSAAYIGGAIALSCFTPDHRLAVFSGAPLRCEIETGEIGSSRDRLFVSGVRPIVDQSGSDVNDVHACVIFRNNVTDTACSSTADRSLNRNGEIDFRVSARYQRYRFFIDGGFEHAHGYSPRIRLAGRR